MRGLVRYVVCGEITLSVLRGNSDGLFWGENLLPRDETN